MDEETKSALPYKETPKADKGTSWDGPEQTRMAEGKSDLRAIHAWVDPEGDPEKKGSYKLPHHLAGGEHAVVWNGVKAAMGALLGARGGVNIPDGDRRGVYNHLAKHYKQFDEETPSFKKLDEIEEKHYDGEHITVKAVFEPELTKDLGEGVLEATVSSGVVDRMGEKINIDGVDLKAYKKNPVVLYGHDYGSLPIGKALSVTKDGSKIVSKFQLAVKEYPFADTVYQLIKGGYLGAVSIGLVVKEWSNDFASIVQSEMVEFSVVPIPANPQALITGKSFSEVTGKDEQTLKVEYEDFVKKSLTKKFSELDLNSDIEALKRLVALLEETHEESQKESATGSERKVYRLALKQAAKEVDKTVQTVIVKLKSEGVK